MTYSYSPGLYYLNPMWNSAPFYDFQERMGRRGDGRKKKEGREGERVKRRDEGRKVGKKEGREPTHKPYPLCGRQFEGNIEGGLYCSSVSNL